jgi:hypothetical protein
MPRFLLSLTAEEDDRTPAIRSGVAFYTYEFLWALVFGFHWIRRAESSTVAA